MNIAQLIQVYYGEIFIAHKSLLLGLEKAVLLTNIYGDS